MNTARNIGNRIIGTGQPVYIIAEIGINHNGDLDVAKAMIKQAHDAGADCVKFQKRTPLLCVPEDQRSIERDTPWGRMTYLDYRYRVEFDEVQANWKVLVENYSECLHCSVVHPELCETVPVYKTGKTTQDERPDWGASLAEGKTAISFAQDENLPLIASMDDMDDYSVFGSYVYPNMLIDVMPTCVAVSTYIPRSATHTTVITDYLFPAEVAINPPVDLKPTLDFNELVNQQDFAVSERVQRGVASKAFRQAYHTEMEKYAQRFVKQYREDTKTN